jgi:hypothetical protein
MQSISTKSSETAAMLLDAWDRRDTTAITSHVEASESLPGLVGCSSLESEQRDLLSGIALALRPCFGTTASSAEAESCLYLLRHLAKRTTAG